MMTREMIEKRIDELDNQMFILAMKDRWTTEDYRFDDKMFAEKRRLLEELKKM